MCYSYTFCSRHAQTGPNRGRKALFSHALVNKAELLRSEFSNCERCYSFVFYRNIGFSIPQMLIWMGSTVCSGKRPTFAAAGDGAERGGGGKVANVQSKEDPGLGFQAHKNIAFIS